MQLPFALLAAALAALPLGAQSDRTALSPAALRARLPDTPTLVERGEELRWEVSGGPSFAVRDVVRGVATIALDGRDLQVDMSALREDAEAGLRQLPELVRLADAAGIDLGSLVYEHAALLGTHLRGEDVMVLPEGLARAEPTPAAETRGRTRAVREAARELVGALPADHLPASAREALDRFVQLLHQRDAQAGRPDGAVAPSFARLMVRNGWLAQLGLGVDGSALLAKLAAAEAPEPVKRLAGEAVAVERLADAFGPRAIVLRTPSRAGYAVDVPPPQFFEQPRGLVTVVWFPPDADPLTAPVAAIRATEVYLGSDRLAAWSRGGGFTADGEGWRKALAASVAEGRGALLDGALPPHILVPSPAGEVRMLVVAGGELLPPGAPSAAEAERFLADAARLLPDAGQLDLIGEYLFRYAFDSPDPRWPLLVGDQTLNGEIHQTAEQTLATALGGIVRGDCDDVAELYLRVLERQGRHGHLMALPRHCAVCWVERAGEGWLARVLQTGPPLQFRGEDVAKSLTAAYQHFALGEVVDPNQLGILLRFSGENVRTPYVLGWRVFADPAYSAVMVDVQRDWHFHTYRHGYEKMRALVAAGDEDTANYRELSGLCQATGQFAASAGYLEQAMARVTDADARLNLAVERVNDLFESGQGAEAKALVGQILDELLPAAREALGPSVPSLGQHLAGLILLHRGNGDLALRVVRAMIADEANRRLLACYRYLGAREFDAQEWHGHPMWEQSRDLLRGFAALVLQIVDEGGTPLARAARPELQTVESWLAVVAFRSPLERGDLLEAFAVAARYWRLALGRERFAALLAEAEPAQGKPEVEQRRVGFVQLLDDLAWIKVSPAFWLEELQDLLGRDAAQLEAERVRSAARGALAAREQARALGMYGPRQDTLLTVAELSLALVENDVAAVRAVFERVRRQDDKILRDLVWRWLGQTARFWPLPWYERVLGLWRETVDFKPSYFGIVWTAVLGKAPEHALAAGRLAAERFADDPVFQQEHAFLRRLLGKD